MSEWSPKKGEKFYCIYVADKVGFETFVRDNGTFTQKFIDKLRSVNNCFKTRKECTDKLKIIKSVLKS